MTRNIFTCAKENDVLGLTRVLESGVDVNSLTANSETPLHFACLAKAYEVSIALISSGANVNIKTDHFLETPLHWAVQEGHLPTINLLLDAGADPNAKNCERESPIFTAIRWDQPEVIPVLAKRGCDINGLNRQKLTPLAVAANFQSPRLVKALLDCGATREVSGVPEDQLDLLTSQKMPRTNTIELLNKPMTANNVVRNKRNVRNAAEATAWFDMVANNHADTLRDSIKRGINANAKVEGTGETLLHAAVSYGASECVKLLIEAGADVNARTDLYQESPLHIAIQEGFFDIFHDLIRAKADIESPNCEGEGPLFTAVKYNRVEMFRVLIRKGANVNKVNFGGLAPIHFAVMDSNQFLTESLLYHGADATSGELNPYLFAFRAGDADIASDLQIAAPMLATVTKLPAGIFSIIKKDDSDALNRLIIKGFDLNLIDVLEGAPLHCAVENRAMKCMKMLLDNGANVNIRNVQKLETPMQIAIRTGNKPAYDLLLNYDIDFTSRNKAGENALFYAIRAQNIDAVKESVKRGVAVNEMNEDGLTALYVAVSLKQTDVVSILLDNDANPNLEIHPSMKLAKEMNNLEVTNLISKSVCTTGRDIRTARKGARQMRQSRAVTPATTSRRGLRSRVVVVQEEPEEYKEHQPGMCHVCERNKATQKLIPCGHVVSCRGCIKNFIEDHLPCPECNLSFYATSTVE